MRTPMSWYDATPSGRIVNRCTKDQDDIDVNLPFTIQIAFGNILQLVFVICMIGVITPLFLILALLVGAYYISTIKYYLKTAREVKRVCSILKAPLLTLISETYNGLYTIRAFDNTEMFYRDYQTKGDTEHRSRINQDYTNRWIALRTDFFGAMIVGYMFHFLSTFSFA
jgi:ABC-type multidrug transport system fused ATPase/permease subunit